MLNIILSSGLGVLFEVRDAFAKPPNLGFEVIPRHLPVGLWFLPRVGLDGPLGLFENSRGRQRAR